MPIFQLFISAVPSSITLNTLQHYLTAQLPARSSRRLVVEKRKTKGKSSHYHAVVLTKSKEDFNFLLECNFILQGHQLEVSHYLSKYEREKQDKQLQFQKVHVANIPQGANSQLIKHIFRKFGDIDNVYIRKDSLGNSLYSFVTFSKRKPAKKLIKLGSLTVQGIGTLILSPFAKKQEVFNSNAQDRQPSYQILEEVQDSRSPLLQFRNDSFYQNEDRSQNFPLLNNSNQTAQIRARRRLDSQSHINSPNYSNHLPIYSEQLSIDQQSSPQYQEGFTTNRALNRPFYQPSSGFRPAGFQISRPPDFNRYNSQLFPIRVIKKPPPFRIMEVVRILNHGKLNIRMNLKSLV